jgi:YD repeat-containing protein
MTERHTPLGKLYRYVYDQNSRLAETRSPGDRIVKRDYDALGRLAKLSASDGQSWTYTYDPNGRPVTIAGPSGEVTYAYDPLDRVTDYRDSSGAAVHIDYDTAGRPQSIKTPDGAKLSYTYNPTGRLGAIATPAGQIKYTYDTAGRVATIAYPNKTRTSYSYVAGTHIRSIVTTDARGKTLLGENYEYDSRGNITAIVRKSETPAVGIAQNRFTQGLGRSEYQYDALNRITEAVFPDGTRELFTYDPAGNLSKYVKQSAPAGAARSEAVTTYAYDADQALTKSGAAELPPDPEGNLCPERVGSNCTAVYDALGRLSAWRDQRYEYDGEGRLQSWRDSNGNTRQYVYLGQHPLMETGASGTAVQMYVPGTDNAGWSALRVGAEELYPIRSVNGSLLAVTDRTGAIVQACSYYTYSPATSAVDATAPSRCEFAGGQHIGPGVWFGMRVLSDIGARFMTADPGGPDKDGNFYSYALGNTLRFVDTSGTSSTPVGGFAPIPPPMSPSAIPAPPRGGFLGNIGNTLKTFAADPSNPVRQEAAQRALDRVDLYQPTFRPAPAGFTAYGSAQRSTGEVILNKARIEATAGALGTSPLAPSANVVAHEVTHLTQGPGALTQLKEWKAGYEGYQVYPELNRSLADEYQRIKVGQSYRNLSADGFSEGVMQDVTRDYNKLKANNYPINPENAATKGNSLEDMLAKDLKEKYPGLARDSGPTEQLGSSVTKNTDKLKSLQAERAAEAAERLPMTATREVAAAESTVSRAVAREAAAAEVAVAEKIAVRQVVENAIERIGSKAGKILGAAGGAAKKAFGFLAAKLGSTGRFLKLAVPVVGEVLMIKDAIDTAVWLGKTAGEAAADLYLAAKRTLLDPLDELANKIAALDNLDEKAKSQKRARRADLLGRASPETLALHDGPPGGITSQAAAQSADAQNQPGAAPGTPLGPTAPLGTGAGQAQNRPDAPPPGGTTNTTNKPVGPTTPLGLSGDLPPNAPPNRPFAPKPSGASPSNPVPSPSSGKPSDQLPSSGARPAAVAPSPQKNIDLSGMCGGSFGETINRMQAGGISGEQASDCWCYFWQKGGSKPGLLYNGSSAADTCGQRLAKAGLSVPTNPAPAQPSAPSHPATASNSGNDPGPPLQGNCSTTGWAACSDQQSIAKAPAADQAPNPAPDASSAQSEGAPSTQSEPAQSSQPTAQQADAGPAAAPPRDGLAPPEELLRQTEEAQRAREVQTRAREEWERGAEERERQRQASLRQELEEENKRRERMKALDAEWQALTSSKPSTSTGQITPNPATGGNAQSSGASGGGLLGAWQAATSAIGYVSDQIK